MIKKTIVTISALRAFLSLAYCMDSAVAVQSENTIVTSVSQFGAKGDGTTDDTNAIQSALNSDTDVLFENKVYLVKGPLTITPCAYKHIDFRGATIVKGDSENWTVRVDRCSNVYIEGGIFLCAVEPRENSKSADAHTFQLVNCSNVVIKNTHINGSGQMGINIMSSNGILTENNLIENCYRDGIYSHYSANVRYINNRLQNIKDDALSFHDYGLPTQRDNLKELGYTQSGHVIISGNTVRHSYQGIVSLGGEKMTITDNIIENTVNGGIVCFISDNLFPGSDAQNRNIIIANNQLFNNAKNTDIMGVTYDTGPVSTTSRSAICVQSQGTKNTIESATRRLSNINISNNLVVDGGTGGISAHNVDNLTVTGNTLVNCNQNVSNGFSNIIDVLSCSGILFSGNNVIDSRPKPLHGRGYYIKDSTGVAVNFNVSGYSVEAGRIEKPLAAH